MPHAITPLEQVVLFAYGCAKLQLEGAAENAVIFCTQKRTALLGKSMFKHSSFAPCNAFAKLAFAVTTLIVLMLSTQVRAVTVVEYFIAGNNSYFLTGRSEEQAALDGLPASFKRSGTQFDAFSAASSPPGTEAYCRFYISDPTKNISSHFYGSKSADCPALLAANLPTFKFENYDFAVYKPLSADTCPAHAPLKIYRSFRPAASGVNPNHRFTLSQREYEDMTAKGWTAEGVAMCAVSGVNALGEQKADVVRLLEQSTLGPTEALVDEVARTGFTRWLNAQLAMNVTKYTQLPWWDPPQDTSLCQDDKAPPITPEKFCSRNKWSHAPVAWEFYRQSKTAPDQLRLRMAHVWHQIFVFGNDPGQAYAAAEFHQRLRDGVFGTFENLLFRFAISPQMGHFQNWVNNTYEKNGIKPNENFARELMQLFTIGVNELSDDGSPKLDANGQQIPAYTQADIEALARVLTGFTYPAKPGEAAIFGSGWSFNGDMVAFEQYHDRGAKSMFGGLIRFPAGLGAVDELKRALNALVNHNNTPAFISKQLIQKMVTSAPSAAYVARVTAVFKDNGSGVRGDLAAVTRAILLDPEARGVVKTDLVYGRLREPVLLWTAMIRGLDVKTDGVRPHESTYTSGQHLFQSPTVFNYYPSDYTLVGSQTPAPEFGIYSTAEFLNRANLVNDLLYAVDQSWSSEYWGPQLYAPNANGTQSPALTAFLPDADKADVLVERLNQLFLHGSMRPAMRQTLVTAVGKIAAADPLRRVKMAVNLILVSVDYQVQK
jgi:uncharacterized protein (DUF1800 family)